MQPNMSRRKRRLNRDTDGGWGWVVVATSLVASTVQVGATISFPAVIYTDLIEAYDVSTSLAGVPSMAASVGSNVAGFFISPFLDSFGYRKIHLFSTALGGIGIASSAFSPNIQLFWILFGLVGGLGAGAAFYTRVVCVQNYFIKHRSLAMGLVTLGPGFSYIFFGVLTRFLSNQYGWRGAVLLTGGLFLQSIPLGFSLKLPNQEVKRLRIPDSQGNKTNTENSTPTTSGQRVCYSIGNTIITYKRLLCDVRCDVFIVGSVAALIGMHTLLGHTPNRAVQSGIDKTRAAMMMSFLGLGSLFGRLVFSIIANIESVSSVLCIGLVTLLGGLATAAMYWAHSFAGLAAGATVGGCFLGACWALFATALRDLLGLGQFKEAYGLCKLCLGVLGSCAVPYAGWLYDVTGSYETAYLVNGSIQVFGGCLFLTQVCWKPRKHATSQPAPIESSTKKKTDEE